MISPRLGLLPDVLALSGALPERHARALAVQAFKSEMIAVEDAGGLACILGFFPLGVRNGVERFELWMVSRPSGASPAVIRAVARLARSTFRARAHSGGVMVVASVRSGWMPGRRLCRLLGLRRWPSRGPLERYGWKDGKARLGPHGPVLGVGKAEIRLGASAASTADFAGQPAERGE